MAVADTHKVGEEAVDMEPMVQVLQLLAEDQEAVAEATGRTNITAQAVAEVQAVQERFERLARAATGSSESDGNPFPLVFEGELLTP